MAPSVGNMAGLFLPLAFANRPKGQKSGPLLDQNNMFKYLAVEGALGLAIGILVLVLWRKGESKESLLLKIHKDKLADSQLYQSLKNSLQHYGEESLISHEDAHKSITSRINKLSILAQLAKIFSNRTVVAIAVCNALGVGFLLAQSAAVTETLVIFRYKEVKKN